MVGGHYLQNTHVYIYFLLLGLQLASFPPTVLLTQVFTPSETSLLFSYFSLVCSYLSRSFFFFIYLLLRGIVQFTSTYGEGITMDDEVVFTLSGIAFIVVFILVTVSFVRLFVCNLFNAETYMKHVFFYFILFLFFFY